MITAMENCKCRVGAEILSLCLTLILQFSAYDVHFLISMRALALHSSYTQVVVDLLQCLYVDEYNPCSYELICVNCIMISTMGTDKCR